MLFEELMEEELEELKPELDHLLALKKTLPEIGMAPKIPTIDAYIQQKMPEIKALAEEIEGKVAEWDALNELFLRMVKKGEI